MNSESTRIHHEHMMPAKRDRHDRLLKVLSVLLLLHGFGAAGTASPAAMRGPRGTAHPSPRVAPIETSAVRIVFLGAIRFFRKNLSPLDGPRCVFEPTCSRYGYRAIEQFGPLKGVMMTGDRLIRCNPSRKGDTEYLLLPNGRVYDPVPGNSGHEE